MALYICKGLRVRRILDLRLCFHDCQEALEAGKALLEHFRKLHQDLDGADENADVEGVHGQVCRLHLPDGDKVSSGHQDGQIHHALEKQGACVEFSHGPVVIVPGADEVLVAPSELFPFDLFVGKGLDHTDPGQGILETGVDVADLSPVVHEGLMHPGVLAAAEKHHKKDHHGQQESQLPIDQE